VTNLDLLAGEIARTRSRYLARLVLRGIAPDDAEDIIQFAALRVVRSPDSFDPRRGTVGAYIWSQIESEAAHRMSQARIPEKRTHERLDRRATFDEDSAGADDPAYDRLGERDPNSIARFTDREAEILNMLSTGLNQIEIAAILDLSLRTVHWHVGSIRRKLGTHSVLESLHRLGCLREFEG
jgi:RNA polymerase sigma factor (sigma-70 family)